LVAQEPQRTSGIKARAGGQLLDDDVRASAGTLDDSSA
jgi:hypothetical protein